MQRHSEHFFHRIDPRSLTRRLAADGIAAISTTRSIARRLKQLSADERADGSREVAAALDPAGADAPLRLQTSITSGHKADFGVMLLDPDPLKIDRVHQRLMAGPLGPAIVPR